MKTITLKTDFTDIRVWVDDAPALEYAEKNDTLFFSAREELVDEAGSALAKIHNAALELLKTQRDDVAAAPVKRFATKGAAVDRTEAIIDALAAPEKSTDQKIREARVTGPTPSKLDEAHKRSNAIIAKTLSSGEKREIWRRPKHEDAQSVAYRPKAGSVQGGLYDILTSDEGGVTMEDYCAAAQKLKTRDATLFTPAQVWGALRYLFVSNRGYGLNFDGHRLKLIKPSDERAAGAKK